MRTSPILPVVQWFFSLSLVFAGVGCASPQKSEVLEKYGPRQMVYRSTYDNTWRAVQLALSKYPLKVNNMDLGVLETDVVKGSKAWKAPHSSEKVSSGLRYNLEIKVVAGKTRTSKATKVSIFKKMSKQRDFFASPEKLPSDGLEEMTILYRIKRELTIESALKKYQEQKFN